ncbi:nucleotidyltransferase family protein [Candidatus Woesearchaeota archaeon]|nr:nucleotidyltransferase family protein [Candidatus Woesearchaeota archaeon]
MVKKGLTKEKIIEVISSNKNELRRFGVSRIGLFGSYQTGKNMEGSDLDFLVSFKEPTFDNYMDLKFYLEWLFGKKVDLVTEDSLKPSLRHVKEKAVYAKV